MQKLLALFRNKAVCLYLATLGGVLLGFAASVVNTNALDRAAYGDVRYVQNIIQMLGVVMLFGYFQSGSRLLALSDSPQRSARLRGALVVILMGCSLLTMLCIAVTSLFHADSPAVATLFLVSLPVCLYPLLMNYVNTTAQGDGHVGLIAAARLLPALIYIPAAWFVYNRFEATPALMILLQLGISTLVLIAVIACGRPSFKGLRPLFSELNAENRAYGLNLYWGSLAMVATNYLAGITLGIFNTDNTNVGFYTLALTLTTPLSYLPAIVGTAYFKEFARQSRIPSQVMRRTSLLTLGTCLLFVLLVGPLVGVLYPAPYAPVAAYAAWMSVGFSIHGVGDMLNRYLGSHGQGKPILYASVACGFVKLGGYVLLVWLWNIEGALLTTILSSAVYFLVLCFYYRRFVGASPKD